MDADQIRIRREALSLLATSPTPFVRESWSHFTASAVVLCSGAVLLHEHRLSGLLLPPGGHFERDETVRQCVEREVMEETGVSCVPQARIVHLYSGPAVRCRHHIDLAVRADATDRSLSARPGESPAVRWFSLSRIARDDRLPADLRACLLSER